MRHHNGLLFSVKLVSKVISSIVTFLTHFVRPRSIRFGGSTSDVNELQRHFNRSRKSRTKTSSLPPRRNRLRSFVRCKNRTPRPWLWSYNNRYWGLWNRMRNNKSPQGPKNPNGDKRETKPSLLLRGRNNWNT